MGQYTQFNILEPLWRSQAVTAWLRIIDSIYLRARRDGVYRDQRGSFTRHRVDGLKRSTNGKFVPRLPRDAYDDGWFNSQPYAEDKVQPGPRVGYIHDPKTMRSVGPRDHSIPFTDRVQVGMRELGGPGR